MAARRGWRAGSARATPCGPRSAIRSTAAEAYRIGLAQWLVPHEQLMAQALQIADDIAELPPLAARMVKESLTRGLDIPNIK